MEEYNMKQKYFSLIKFVQTLEVLSIHNNFTYLRLYFNYSLKGFICIGLLLYN